MSAAGFPSGGGDELPFEQGLEYARAFDPADGLDFRGRDRLLVGNDGERLQRGQGQGRARPEFPQELL